MGLALRNRFVAVSLTALALVYAIYGIASRYQAVRLAGLLWGRDNLERCISEKGITQPSGHPFAICRRWSENDGEFIHAIVFDGSDRIGGGTARLPTRWQNEIEACVEGSRVEIFCRAQFRAQPLTHHLFDVTFLR